MSEGDPKFAADDSPLTWRDQRDMSRVSASVRQNLIKFNQRPHPPRGVRFSGGALRWEKPVDSSQVTHYRVYANDEKTLVREVPDGQLQISDGLSADRVFVSAINKNSDLESQKTLLAQQILPTFAGLQIVGPGTGGAIFTNDLSPDSILIGDGSGGAFQVEISKSGADYIADLELINPNGSVILLKNQSTGGVELLTQMIYSTRSITQRITGSITEIIADSAGRLGNPTNYWDSIYVKDYNVKNVGGTANTFLTLGGVGDALFVSANSFTAASAAVSIGASDFAGGTAAISLTSGTRVIAITGHVTTQNDSLSAKGLVIRDANGTTTGNSLEIQKFDGSPFFKVIGGTDAGAPGTVATAGDVVPFNTDTKNLGNSTHRWSTLYGVALDITATDLARPGLLIADASGTTTGNSVEITTFGGTVYFKIIGGTDAGAPGTVVSHDHVPFVDDAKFLGNSSHRWRIWSSSIIAQTSINLTGATVTAPNGVLGVTGTKTPPTSLTVSGGIITAWT